jgi:hypothetical protein
MDKVHPRDEKRTYFQDGPMTCFLVLFEVLENAKKRGTSGDSIEQAAFSRFDKYPDLCGGAKL